MKINYSHDIFTEQEYGGVSRYFTEIISIISKLNPEVNVISGFYFNEYLNHLNAPCKITGTKIKKNFFTNKFTIRIINELYQSSLLKAEKGSIFHQTYYSPFPINTNLQVVVTVHDMVHELFPNMFHKQNLTSYAKMKSCQRADKIIAVSESTKNDLINIFDINPKKIEVIYHGSNFSNNIRKIDPYKHQTPYLLFVGSRKLYKNFDKLLKIFSNSSKISNNFSLICFGGGKFTREEKIQISHHKLDGIVYQKSGTDSTLANYYSGAVALVYPSLYEGFGIPILEAMSMNCPVICSNQSSIPEVASDAAIYFNPNEIDHIQSVLEEALFDKYTLKQTVKKGFERQKNFTWEDTAQKTLDVYNGICES